MYGYSKRYGVGRENKTDPRRIAAKKEIPEGLDEYFRYGDFTKLVKYADMILDIQGANIFVEELIRRREKKVMRPYRYDNEFTSTMMAISIHHHYYLENMDQTVREFLMDGSYWHDFGADVDPTMRIEEVKVPGTMQKKEVLMKKIGSFLPVYKYTGDLNTPEISLLLKLLQNKHVLKSLKLDLMKGLPKNASNKMFWRYTTIQLVLENQLPELSAGLDTEELKKDPWWFRRKENPEMDRRNKLAAAKCCMEVLPVLVAALRKFKREGEITSPAWDSYNFKCLLSRLSRSLEERPINPDFESEVRKVFSKYTNGLSLHSMGSAVDNSVMYYVNRFFVFEFMIGMHKYQYQATMNMSSPTHMYSRLQSKDSLISMYLRNLWRRGLFQILANLVDENFEKKEALDSHRSDLKLDGSHRHSVAELHLPETFYAVDVAKDEMIKHLIAECFNLDTSLMNIKYAPPKEPPTELKYMLRDSFVHQDLLQRLGKNG